MFDQTSQWFLVEVISPQVHTDVLVEQQTAVVHLYGHDMVCFIIKNIYDINVYMCCF